MANGASKRTLRMLGMDEKAEFGGLYAAMRRMRKYENERNKSTQSTSAVLGAADSREPEYRAVITGQPNSPHYQSYRLIYK